MKANRSACAVLPLVAAFVGACATTSAPTIDVAPAAAEAATTPAAPVQPDESLGADLDVHAIARGVWLHIARDAGGIPANGLIVEAEPASSVLIDSAWSDSQANRLIAFARDRLHHPITQAVVTHSHEDRSGGIEALRAQGIRVTALDLTAELLRSSGKRPPDGIVGHSPSAHEVRQGDRTFELFYPGAGHSRDNLVVWIPNARILFGGCLIKAAEAPALGNTKDADLASWPVSVRAVASRYASAEIVVPGHGAVGDTALFTKTLGLLDKSSAK